MQKNIKVDMLTDLYNFILKTQDLTPRCSQVIFIRISLKQKYMGPDITGCKDWQ